MAERSKDGTDERAKLQQAFDETASVFQTLRTVRNRRVSRGWAMNSGLVEQHPVTGRTMSQAAAPLRHESSSQSLPLTEAEEALLCWAACGPNGLVAWDWVFSGGFNQVFNLAGRTSPSPHNTAATDLLVINDAGVHLYRPSNERSGVVEFADGDFGPVLDWYRNDRIEILPQRPVFDWAMWQQAAPTAPLSGTANYNLNRPGSTWLVPITDSGHLMFTLLDLMATGHKYIYDDFNGDVPAGLDPWVEPGRLELGISISAFEQSIVQAESYPSGALTQNVRIAAESMGLGCWTVSGYNRDVLLGAFPQITPGLGFSYAKRNDRAPVETGRLKCLGLPGVLEATVVPSPRFPDGASVVRSWREERFGPGGWADDSADGLLRRGQSAWKDEVVQEILQSDQTAYPEWVWEAATAYIDHCVAAFGQWPATFNPIQTHWSAVLHHLDEDFYDRFYKDGILSEAVRTHGTFWH